MSCLWRVSAMDLSWLSRFVSCLHQGYVIFVIWLIQVCVMVVRVSVMFVSFSCHGGIRCVSWLCVFLSWLCNYCALTKHKNYIETPQTNLAHGFCYLSCLAPEMYVLHTLSAFRNFITYFQYVDVQHPWRTTPPYPVHPNPIRYVDTLCPLELWIWFGS